MKMEYIILIVEFFMCLLLIRSVIKFYKSEIKPRTVTQYCKFIVQKDEYDRDGGYRVLINLHMGFKILLLAVLIIFGMNFPWVQAWAGNRTINTLEFHSLWSENRSFLYYAKFDLFDESFTAPVKVETQDENSYITTLYLNDEELEIEGDGTLNEQGEGRIFIWEDTYDVTLLSYLDKYQDVESDSPVALSWFETCASIMWILALGWCLVLFLTHTLLRE